MALNVVDCWGCAEIKRGWKEKAIGHWAFRGAGDELQLTKGRGAASDRNKTGWMHSHRKQGERCFLRMEWTGVKNSVKGSWKMQTENLPVDFTTFRSLVIKKFTGVMGTDLDWSGWRELEERKWTSPVETFSSFPWKHNVEMRVDLEPGCLDLIPVSTNC